MASAFKLRIIRGFLQACVLLFSVLLYAGSARAQVQWTRQSPLPAARNLSGSAWATPTHGFIAGEHLTFMETFDGGQTWRSINLPAYDQTNPFYGVFFRDPNNGFLIGNSGTGGPDHWRTTDAGQNWTRITSFPLGGSWRQLDFVSPTTALMGSNGAVVSSADGGATWNLMSGYPSCPVIYGMDYLNEQVGLAGGNRVSTTDGGSGIFKTTDGGINWVRKYPLSANDVIWLNSTTAIATSGANILRSVDAGENWSVLSSAIFTGLDDIELLQDGVTVVGVSDAGDIWRSADSGATWTRIVKGIGALPASWAVSFLNNQVGSVVGASGIIYRTTDSGLTWKMLNHGVGGITFYDIEMFTESFGMAVGDNGYLIRTTDSGANWETQKLQVTGQIFGRDEGLKAVDIVDQDFAVAAGPGGLVFKTFDAGVSWQSVGYPNLPDTFTIEDVKFITRTLGWVVGSNEDIHHHDLNLYRTNDGGATWTLVPIAPALWKSVDFVDADHGWITSAGSRMERTDDGGVTWQDVYSPNQGFNPSLSAIDFANVNEGWAVGWYGHIVHTIDGGRTWQLQTSGTMEEHFLGVDVLSPTQAYAATGSGSVFYTNDGGATWTRVSVPGVLSLSDVSALSTGKVWVSGYDGAVLTSNFNVPAPALLLTLNPTRIIGGEQTTGTITLRNPAPTNGTVINLSSNSSVISVPQSVTVPAGQTSVTFPITSQIVSQASTRATITAIGNSQTRQAELVIAPQVTCSFSLSPTSEHFGSSGGTVVVNVTAPGGCTWTASSGSSWISIVNGSSGNGNGSVTVSVAPNTFNLSRFTSISIAGQPFSVYQVAAGGCAYSLASNEKAFGKGGGNASVSITVGSSCSWTARSNVSWITINTPGGQGDGTISYTVDPSYGSLPRVGTLTIGARIYTIKQNVPNKIFDVDRDGKEDIAVWRPSNGVWYISKSLNGSFDALQWGAGSLGDLIVPGDYDGDMISDRAVWRSSTGDWHTLLSSNGAHEARSFGTAGDIPAPADFDGDGRADVTVFRPSNGLWYIWQSSTGSMRAEAFGTNGDVPVAGDYDGDGRADIAVYRPSNGVWYMLRSSDGSFYAQQFGLATDKPVPGDYDADGKTDIAVWRPSNGTWYLLQSAAGFYAQQFGLATDKPAPGDFDGDGRMDLSVFRDGSWYIRQSTNNAMRATSFGQTDDRPVTSIISP